MSEFRLQTGYRLRLRVVLLQRQADRVIEFGPNLFALVGVSAVISRETDLAKTQLTGFVSDVGRNVMLRVWLGSRFDIARNPRRFDQRLADRVVLLAIVVDLFDVNGPTPVAVGRFLDGLRFDRVFPVVVGNIAVDDGRARHRYQILRHRYRRFRVADLASRPGYDVIY